MHTNDHQWKSAVCILVEVAIIGRAHIHGSSLTPRLPSKAELITLNVDIAELHSADETAVLASVMSNFPDGMPCRAQYVTAAATSSRRFCEVQIQTLIARLPEADG